MKGTSKNIKFYSVKDEIRILGLDDAPFEFKKEGKTMIVGVVFRGGAYMDGVLRSEVEVDGIDSTDKVVEMVNKTKFKDIRVIMQGGLGFAGFNLVDIERLNNETGLPVIVVVRRMPDFAGITDAMKSLRHKEYCQKCIETAGKPKKVETRDGKHIYIQYRGITFADAKAIVQLSSTHSLIPEPIRAAHLIASGIALGESRGGA